MIKALKIIFFKLLLCIIANVIYDKYNKINDIRLKKMMDDALNKDEED